MSRTVRQGGLGSASSGAGSLQTPLRVAVPAGARQRLLLRDLHVVHDVLDDAATDVAFFGLTPGPE